MEQKYTQAEDFAADDSFVNYCFSNNREDVQYWKKWLKAHPDKRKEADKAREMIFIAGIQLPPEQKQTEWEKIKQQWRQTGSIPAGGFNFKKSRKRVRWLSGAALFAVLVGTWWLLGGKGSDRTEIYRDESGSSAAIHYQTRPGEQRKITLEGGTEIRLNADSRLTLYDSAGREVGLSGEAYFDVSADPGHPFVIHTHNMDITVLGTTLNVRDYPGDNQAETALLTGKAAVKLRSDSSRKIILKPDEKIIAYKAVKQIKPLKTPDHSEITLRKHHFTVAPLVTDSLFGSKTMATAWMENKLIFRDEPFGELAARMGRKYNVHFHFASRSFKDYRFTGVFSKETVEEALQALQLTSPSDPFEFTIEGKDIFIKKKTTQ